ncbi:ras GTPase-activating -binding 1 isoform X1 [Labeo rohita]|uniref:Ras GTPase-activating-binding 1 isoform X1 n=1 Tax=Labeo rohita TaxID=84645 RepID=A0A498NTC7_LABRO|nr:ras GTPase-activating -binding 1 isoform X1 [Labeo rohita]
MVMEKPSAQLVGREFVRQYYTLLNQAPDYLHRFYGKNSSYVHGGLDNNGKPVEAVYGQSEIHKKVMALSFRDCHTKIRHVDAHATLNEGVVVQVLGELSNNMQPMRKFMQTFVLAPEGTVANKFYVHNDIFRYQDEVFGDSDSEPPEVREGESGESEVRRTVRYPDSHQLFVGNVPHDVDKNELKEFFEQYGTVLELRINSGGKLPNFGFVVFDDAEPVQKILNNRPIKLRGDVRLNVEEKKTRSAREGDRRDIRPRGPGGPRDRVGGSRGPPARGGMAQKPSFGAGRGTGPSEGRYAGPPDRKCLP